MASRRQVSEPRRFLRAAYNRLKEAHYLFDAEFGTAAGIAQVLWWSTDLRYEPRELPLDEAKVFLAASRAILDWVKGST